MITKLIGVASLFAAGSFLPAATAPTLGAREITPAAMAPLAANPASRTELQGRCGGSGGGGRRCATGPQCARRCATGPQCARRCATQPQCARRCATQPQCGHRGQ